MRDFYLTYHANPKLQPLVAEIGWTHNGVIMDTPKPIGVAAYRATAKHSKGIDNPKEVVQMLKSKQVASRKSVSPSEMNTVIESAMKHIATIHSDHEIESTDWVFHQAIRFIFDGYPHHAGPLFSRLEELEGDSLRVQGLRLIFKSEAIRPTPFGGLCAKPGQHVQQGIPRTVLALRNSDCEINGTNSETRPTRGQSKAIGKMRNLHRSKRHRVSICTIPRRLHQQI